MMAEQRLTEMRCHKCGKKLAEYALTEGTIRIFCVRRAGQGREVCKTMNEVSIVSMLSSDMSYTENKNAI